MRVTKQIPPLSIYLDVPLTAPSFPFSLNSCLVFPAQVSLREIRMAANLVALADKTAIEVRKPI